MVQESYTFSLFELPPDAGWSDIEDTPEDLRRILEIYDSAKRDDVEGSIIPIKKIDAFYDAFDGLEGQDVVVAKDASDSIVGVASLDTRRNPPFFEGVSVHPSHRNSGVARQLTQLLLAKAIETGVSTVHSRSQPTSLIANTRLLLSLGVDFEILGNQKYPLIVIDLGTVN